MSPTKLRKRRRRNGHENHSKYTQALQDRLAQLDETSTPEVSDAVLVSEAQDGTAPGVFGGLDSKSMEAAGIIVGGTVNRGRLKEIAVEIE